MYYYIYLLLLEQKILLFIFELAKIITGGKVPNQGPPSTARIGATAVASIGEYLVLIYCIVFSD
jgi:hypothetical protein